MAGDLSGHYAISITGDSNDSNLVLGSTSGTVTESESVNVSGLNTAVAGVKTDVSGVNTAVGLVASAVADNKTHLEELMTKLNTFSVAERDLLDVIKDRGYIKVGYKTQANNGAYDNSNVGQLGMTSSGYIPNLAKAIAQAIFGEDTLRIVDSSGVLLQEGKLQPVRVETATRFTQLNADEFDIVIHFPTMTMDRMINQGVAFSFPIGNASTRSLCRTSDLSGIADASLNSNLDTIKYLESELGHVRFGTSDNCTAKVWGETFKQEYPDISLSIVITNMDGFKSGESDMYTSDDWYVASNTGTDTSYSLIAAAPSGSVLDFNDYLGVALKRDQKNNKLMSVVNTVLSVQLRAMELDISSGNVDSVTEPASTSAVNNLLFGKNLGFSFNTYLAGDMVADAGKRILQYGNAEERASLLDIAAGVPGTVKKLVPSYGMVGLVPNSKNEN